LRELLPETKKYAAPMFGSIQYPALEKHEQYKEQKKEA